VQCHWNYVHCNTVIGGQVVNARWFLGIEGIFLPGKGLGIESVEEGSPAALVGLTSGMVIIEANGVAMESEEAMQQVIAASQGILQVVVLSEGSEQPLQGTIQMLRLVSSNF
jgi:S1-C subfamily serine protease